MGSESQYLKRITMPWQYRALQYYDQIGELHFASHFLARMMSRVRYYPATLNDDGSTEPITSGAPVELLNRIQDPGGGRSRVQYSYGLLSFITGEGVLFGYNEGRDWKFLWKDEIKFRDDGSAVRLYPDKRESSEVGVGYRVWTPHPRQSDLPDSPVSSVMDICEELIILTQSVRATAVSRITNGLMKIPQELSFGAAEPLGDEDMENDPFLADYSEHMVRQVENPGSAESMVPFSIIGNYDYLDRFEWMKTHDPATDYMEQALRVECVKRMALGLDMPPEALLGMTDANHWTAKQVMHDMWRTHGVPKAEAFADDLNQAYLRPALEQEEFPGFEDVVVDYDDSKVVISPDRTDDADQAFDRGQINDDAYAVLKGFDASFAATEEDKKIYLATKLRDPSLLKGTKYYVEPPEPPAMAPGPPGGPRRNGDASDGPPAPTRGRAGSRQESVRASAHILGAADLALLRCRELAGIRIRQKCRECAKGVPVALVASTVGQIDAGDPISLVREGASSFYALLLERGFGEAHAGSLAQTLEIFAAKTLFQPEQPDLPSAFAAQVENAQEAVLALAHH
jgi:hypothetical protein